MTRAEDAETSKFTAEFAECAEGAETTKIAAD
jgi:hypothetical protein